MLCSFPGNLNKIDPPTLLRLGGVSRRQLVHFLEGVSRGSLERLSRGRLWISSGECLGGVLKDCHGGISRGSFSGECLGGVSRASVSGECLGGVSRGSFSGEFLGRVSRGSVSGECLCNVGGMFGSAGKAFGEWKGWSVWDRMGWGVLSKACDGSPMASPEHQSITVRCSFFGRLCTRAPLTSDQK